MTKQQSRATVHHLFYRAFKSISIYHYLTNDILNWPKWSGQPGEFDSSFLTWSQPVLTEMEMPNVSFCSSGVSLSHSLHSFIVSLIRFLTLVTLSWSWFTLDCSWVKDEFNVFSWWPVLTVSVGEKKRHKCQHQQGYRKEICCTD